MSYDLHDTIAAIASAPGGAFRGIVRLAGPQTAQCLAACVTGSIAWHAQRLAVARPAVMHVEPLRRDVPCQVYFWPTARSYTRQPAAELHLPGSPPLLEAVLETLGGHGARLAQPGEFTLRAFLAGRLDLMQAEAVLGVIDAGDRRALETALRQLAGGLSRPLESLREDLLDALAQVEAGLDFVEEDIEFITDRKLLRRLRRAEQRVAGLLSQMHSRDSALRLPQVVLVGLPNVGKSSLFNALTRADAALVADIAGTTRDYLLAPLDLDGVRCELVDTAGITGAGEGPDAQAQRLQHRQRRQAAVELFCIDASRPLHTEEQTALAKPPARRRLVVATKGDLPRRATLPQGALVVSSVRGSGLVELRAALRAALVSIAGPADGGDVVETTAQRCRQSLVRAGRSLRRARRIVRAALGQELAAAEIRRALDCLGQVTGAVHTDDVLDRIFSRFCIGK